MRLLISGSILNKGVKMAEESIQITDSTAREMHEKLQAKTSEAAALLAQINEIQQEHEPGGCFYEVTKKILEMYRYMRFNSLEPVIRTSVEEFQEYGIDLKDNTGEQAECVDFMLALPKDMYCNKNELYSFVNSSAPETIQKFIGLIDASMKALQAEDKYSAKLLSLYYLDRTKRTKEDVAGEMKISITTFFRKKKLAITKLSIFIFGPLGEKHPDFSLSRLNKNYHSRLFEVADKIDELFSE